MIFPDNNKESVFEKIKTSIDKDIPVLALFGRIYQWILITGGASGIGRASVIAFAKTGANVFIVDIDLDGMNTVVDEITSAGGSGKRRYLAVFGQFFLRHGTQLGNRRRPDRRRMVMKLISRKLQLAASAVLAARKKKKGYSKVALNLTDIAKNERNRRDASYINVPNSIRFNFAVYAMSFPVIG